MNSRVIAWISALAVCSIGGELPGLAADASPPEPLRVSENGHFLVTESGRGVFLLADTAWGLVAHLKREEMASYLRHRRNQLFNAVTFVVYMPGNPDISSTVTDAYGHAPFAVVNGRPDPTQPRTTPGANPANADEYDFWDHLDYAVALTKKLGLYAIILPTWGSAVVGDYSGKPTGDIVFNSTNARVYGQWIAHRYAAEPHVLWMLGGDRRAVYGELDSRSVFQAMAQGLTEGGGGAHKLISFHPPKKSPQSADWFHGDTWLSFNSNQHWPEDQVPALTRDWGLVPPKPTWVFEGRYEAYWKSNYKPEQWGEWQCRQQAWQSVLAGGFGFTYGHERVFGFGKDGWDWRKELDAPGARCMTYLAKFMNLIPVKAATDRVPDQSLLAGALGKPERLKSDFIAASRSADGHFAMFYAANGRNIRVKLDRLAVGPMSAWWFNPRNGTWHTGKAESSRMEPFTQDIATGPGSSEREFDPPDEPATGNDWVLVLSEARAFAE